MAVSHSFRLSQGILGGSKGYLRYKILVGNNLNHVLAAGI